MQAIEELALKVPLELRMVQVPWMKLEIISVYGNSWILKLDDDFHTFVLGPR